MTEPTLDGNVLIVGAGPAGLFAACELMRHGVKPRILERRAAPHREARGTALQPATLEMLHRAGLLEAFLERGVQIHTIQALARFLPDAELPPGAIASSGFRVIAQSHLDDIGCAWNFQCSLPQYATEDILRARLAELGVEIEFGAEVESIVTADNGLDVTVRRDGESQMLRASHVLGAGGAGSVTRHSMQLHLDGETYDGVYVVADVRLDLERPAGTGGIVLGPEGFVLLSPLPEGRWLIFVNLEGDGRPEAPPSEAELRALVDARLGLDAGLGDMRWASCFRMHRRVANRLSDRRRFLLGDAGHLSSPLGGEGVNAALMDAADIAWKLALVRRGDAPESLLDTYALERGLADAHVLAVSDEIHGAVMGLVDAFRAGETPVAPPETAGEARAVARRRSMLDISLLGSPLVAGALSGQTEPSEQSEFAQNPENGSASRSTLIGEGSGEPPVAAGDRFPQRARLEGEAHHLVCFGKPPGLSDFATRWRRLVAVIDGDAHGLDRGLAGFTGDGMALVRPDGYIGFHAGADAAALTALDAHLAGYLYASEGNAAL
ncbi:FAD-dependent monooxygenase [Camelimonas sp. ID_303_24]